MSILIAATDVLRLFAEGHPKIGVATLVQRMKWPKSTCSRVLAQMAEHDLLERDPVDRQYRLGALVLQLGHAQRRAQLPLQRQAHDALAQLCARSGHAGHLSILDGTDSVLLEQVAGSHPLQVMSPIGRRLPAHGTAMGRALLSRLSDEGFIARYGADPATRLPPSPPRCPQTVGALAQRVSAARAARSASAFDEGLPGVAAVATTVHDSETRTTLGLALSFPARQVSADEAEEFRHALVTLAASVGRAFGDPWWQVGATPPPPLLLIS